MASPSTLRRLPAFLHPPLRPHTLPTARRRTVPAQPRSRSYWWSSRPPPPPLFASLPPHSIPDISPDLLPLLSSLLHSIQDDETTSGPLNPPWRVVDLSKSGKGYGALLSRPVARGELLWAERPLFIWPSVVSDARAEELFDRLGKREKEVFGELAMTDGVWEDRSPVWRRRATNAFSVRMGERGTKNVSMVFPRIARINHSCLPNASQAMNFQTLRLEIYPLLSLPTSIELTIEYLPSLILLSTSQRRLALSASFGIKECLCELCTAPREVREKSDERRKEIKLIGDALRRERGERERSLKRLERVRVLLEEEGYHGLPEFDDPSISNAYAVYATLYARSKNTSKSKAL